MKKMKEKRTSKKHRATVLFSAGFGLKKLTERCTEIREREKKKVNLHWKNKHL